MRQGLLVRVTAATGCLSVGDSGNAMQLLLDSKQALLQGMLIQISTYFICNDSIFRNYTFEIPMLLDLCYMLFCAMTLQRIRT